MKIRVNYVSNSSSSSCIIRCKQVGSINEFNEIDFKDSAIYFIIGDWLNDGLDVIYFHKDSDLFNLLKKYNGDLNSNIESVIYELYDEVYEAPLYIDAFKLISDNQASCEVMHMEVDYHRTESEEDFKRRYLNE